MKQDIFTQAGKRTPYRIPEGFFAQQEQTLKQAVSNPQIVNRQSFNRKWFYAAAACAILLIAVDPVMQLIHRPSSSLSSGESRGELIYSQSSSAADDWSDFAEADIFMDNMNW